MDSPTHQGSSSAAALEPRVAAASALRPATACMLSAMRLALEVVPAMPPVATAIAAAERSAACAARRTAGTSRSLASSRASFASDADLEAHRACLVCTLYHAGASSADSSGGRITRVTARDVCGVTAFSRCTRSCCRTASRILSTRPALRAANGLPTAALLVNCPRPGCRSPESARLRIDSLSTIQRLNIGRATIPAAVVDAALVDAAAAANDGGGD
jgi:hypothetical protein